MNIACFSRVLCLGMLISLCITTQGLAQNSVSPDSPINVTADSMSYEPEKNRVTFNGNVQVVRDAFTLWSSLLTLHLKPSGNSSQESALDPTMELGDLDRIVAENNVRFTFNTQSGTAQKATYTLDTATLVLEGNPSLRDGENSITGNIIRYFLNENRSEVEGGQGRRVEAIFNSGSMPR